MDHDSDVFAWTQEQAAALRRVADTRVNLPGLDLENLAEEIEDMGNGILSKIEGLVTQIVAHLLKLRFSPAEDPRNHWKREVQAWRVTVAQPVKRAPSVTSRLDMAEIYASARLLVEIDAEAESWSPLPEACPFTLSDTLDPRWWPEQVDRP